MLWDGGRRDLQSQSFGIWWVGTETKKSTFLKKWTLKYSTWINVCSYVPSLLIMHCYHYCTKLFFFKVCLVKPVWHVVIAAKQEPGTCCLLSDDSEAAVGGGILTCHSRFSDLVRKEDVLPIIDNDTDTSHCQCDSESACAILGPWDWSSRVELSHCL